jgi:hypothetical protein
MRNPGGLRFSSVSFVCMGLVFSSSSSYIFNPLHYPLLFARHEKAHLEIRHYE